MLVYQRVSGNPDDVRSNHWIDLDQFFFFFKGSFKLAQKSEPNRSENTFGSGRKTLKSWLFSCLLLGSNMTKIERWMIGKQTCYLILLEIKWNPWSVYETRFANQEPGAIHASLLASNSQWFERPKQCNCVRRRKAKHQPGACWTMHIEEHLRETGETVWGTFCIRKAMYMMCIYSVCVDEKHYLKRSAYQ